MSSASEETAGASPGRLRRLRAQLPSIAAALLLLAAAVGSFIGGCIRRVPAPADDAPTEAPYSAVATWRDVTIPPLPEGESGSVLVQPALRLSFDRQSRPWMDSALVDGRAGASIHEEVAPALEALLARSEPIVVIGIDGLPCSALKGLEDRIQIAAGLSRYSKEGQELPGDSESGRESLRGVPLTVFCPPVDAADGSGEGGARDGVLDSPTP